MALNEKIKKIVKKHGTPGTKILCAGGPSNDLRRVGLKNVRIVSINLLWRDYERYSKLGLFVQGSATKAPFKDNAFDFYFSSNVYEHIDEPWVAAEEAVRITKPGGTILVYAPFGYRWHVRPDYYRFSPDGLKFLFERTKKVKTILCEMDPLPPSRKDALTWTDYFRTTYYGTVKK